MKKHIINWFFMIVGAITAGFALEGFLVPNNIIDGGIVGISIMASTITKVKLGLFIFIFNTPFILMALKKMGKMFVVQTLCAITILSLSVTIFHGHHVTDDLLLATVFGGLVLGVGVGLVLRCNAALDGTEMIAIRLAKKFGFSIGEIIMFFNLFIFGLAGFLYGWDKAMYSILTYFIAYKAIDVVIEGLSETKSIMIISDNSYEIGQALITKLDVTVTYMEGKGGYSGLDKIMIYCVIPKMELFKLKELVKTIDPTAFIAIEDVHEVEGTRIKSKNKN